MEKEIVIGILAALGIVIFLLTLGPLKIKEDKIEQSQYEFTIESNMDQIPFGTSQIRNVFEDYWAKDYPERMVLFYGRVQTLFGQPMYETEDLENQYSYWVYTVTEDGKIIYLNIYSASTGPAIGGFQNEESKKAADALVKMILQAEPADYEYRGYYFGDVVLEEHWTVKNGVANMEEKPLNLSEEEFVELFNRIHGLEEPEMETEEEAAIESPDISYDTSHCTDWQLAYLEKLSTLKENNQKWFQGNRESDYVPYKGYSVYDVDGNGVPELILRRGLDEAGSHWEIYTYENDEVVLIDDLPGKHTDLYTYPSKQALFWVHSDPVMWSVDELKIENGKLLIETIDKSEGPDDMWDLDDFDPNSQLLSWFEVENLQPLLESSFTDIGE